MTVSRFTLGGRGQPVLSVASVCSNISAMGSARSVRTPSDASMERLSELCLGLPEAIADDRHPPHRGFSVNGKNFAWYTEDEHGDGRVALCVRAERGENEALVRADPERYGLPKYVARHGWVSYYLDLPGRPVDWEELTELVQDSYRLQAPRRLAALVGAATSGARQVPLRRGTTSG